MRHLRPPGFPHWAPAFAAAYWIGRRQGERQGQGAHRREHTHDGGQAVPCCIVFFRNSSLFKHGDKNDDCNAEVLRRCGRDPQLTPRSCHPAGVLANPPFGSSRYRAPNAPVSAGRGRAEVLRGGLWFQARRASFAVSIMEPGAGGLYVLTWRVARVGLPLGQDALEHFLAVGGGSLS